jgi:hypothetical protein
VIMMLLLIPVKVFSISCTAYFLASCALLMLMDRRWRVEVVMEVHVEGGGAAHWRSMPQKSPRNARDCHRMFNVLAVPCSALNPYYRGTQGMKP